jgi:8-oxo-dGTP pyrophosphatase MutT (NUDIX family)
MAAQEKIHGAGGVLIQDGQVLLIVEDQSDNRYGKQAGMLSIPMGRIKPGEIPHRAAEREFQEETGLTVYTGQYLMELPAPPDGLVKIFAMAIDGDDSPSPDKGLNPRWMGIEEFLSQPEASVRPPSKAAVRLALQWQSLRTTSV